jgi:hypothetical protein
MSKTAFAYSRFNCECGFSFNQVDGNGKKFEMVKRLHKKRCNKYVESECELTTGKLRENKIVKVQNILKSKETKKIISI